MDRAAQRRIMREDTKRRNARELNDLILLCSSSAPKDYDMTPGAYVNAELVRGIGTVNPPLPTSASRNQWDRSFNMRRTVGIAPGTEHTSDGTPTVRVIKPGVEPEIRAASSFRKPRAERTTHSTRSIRNTHTAEVARLAPVQNYEQDS